MSMSEIITSMIVQIDNVERKTIVVSVFTKHAIFLMTNDNYEPLLKKKNIFVLKVLINPKALDAL